MAWPDWPWPPYFTIDLRHRRPSSMPHCSRTEEEIGLFACTTACKMQTWRSADDWRAGGAVTLLDRDAPKISRDVGWSARGLWTAAAARQRVRLRRRQRTNSEPRRRELRARRSMPASSRVDAEDRTHRARSRRSPHPRRRYGSLSKAVDIGTIRLLFDGRSTTYQRSL